jgi:hypothetical protein
MAEFKKNILRWYNRRCLKCGAAKVDWVRHSSCDVCPICDLANVCEWKRLMTCNLYRTLWFNSLGYLVYRHCFEVHGDEINTRIGAVQHKVAVFVLENDAKDYCAYRNRLTDQNGSDALPLS